jgi:spermidine synthase
MFDARIGRVTHQHSSEQQRRHGGTLAFALTLSCFLLSGFSALIYQTVWLKQLAVVFGTAHVAVATVLAAYMAGLAAGAALAARLIDRIRNPLRAYAWIEALIGVSALLVPLLLVGVERIFVLLFGGQASPVADEGFTQPLFYVVATFLLLLVPTAGMGASLPLLSRFAVATEEQLGPRVGLLYGINTIGAVAGTLIAAFLLLPYLGVYGALGVGAALNGVVFLLAWMLAKSVAAGEPQAAVAASPSRPRFHWILPIMLVSGAVSFTLEVLWARLLTHVFGGTVYAFAVMLAAFLSGIAIGSLIAGRMARTREGSITLFVATQSLAAALSLAAYWLMLHWVPALTSLPAKAWYGFVIVFPATVFIGATFPLAVRIHAQRPEEAGASSGIVYAWNTLGAIGGALLAGFLLLPALGFGSTLKITVAVALGLAVLAAMLRSSRRLAYATVPALALVLALGALHPPRPERLLQAHAALGGAVDREIYFGVGRSATVMLRERRGYFLLSNDGLSEAIIYRRGTVPHVDSHMWLTALPVLARPKAASLLLIGLGGGVAIEGAPPSVREIDVIELEQQVVAANAAVAGKRAHDPLADPRVNLAINDARSAMRLGNRRYDLIVSQPSHPWIGGSANLYTREFASLAKARLTDGGVFLQWINARFVDEGLLRSIAATLLEQFRYVELYQPETEELMFVASGAPLDIWDGEVHAASALAAHRAHYNRIGMRAVEDALIMWVAGTEALRSFAGGAPVNTDDRNRLGFFSRVNANGLRRSDVGRLFAAADPLTSPSARSQRGLEQQFDVAYIANRLLLAGDSQRAYEMARVTEDESLRETIDALGYASIGNGEQAARLYGSALARDPRNQYALFELIEPHFDAYAAGRTDRNARALAGRLDESGQAVLQGWALGSAGKFDQLAGLDAQLARTDPRSPAYPIAVKLRADWRVARSTQLRDPAPARQALEIVDGLLASFASFDLYRLRTACAYLSGDEPAFVESIREISVQMAKQLDAAAGAGKSVSAAERQQWLGLLESLATHLRRTLPGQDSEHIQSVLNEADSLLRRLRFEGGPAARSSRSH